MERYKCWECLCFQHIPCLRSDSMQWKVAPRAQLVSTLFICLAIWNLNRTIEFNKNHSITIVLKNITDKSHTAAFNMLQSVSKSHNEVTISQSFYVRNHKSRVAHLQLFIRREVKLLKKYRDVGQIQTQERTLLYSSSCHVIAHWSRRELVNVLLSKIKQE